MRLPCPIEGRVEPFWGCEALLEAFDTEMGVMDVIAFEEEGTPDSGRAEEPLLDILGVLVPDVGLEMC